MGDGLYRELPPPPDLAAHLRCLWYRRIGPAEARQPIRIVPDGCMDLMWQDGRLLVAGPDTTAQLSTQAAGTEFVGLRFRPGAAPPLLGVPASELLDARPDAAAVWGRQAAEVGARLEAVRSPAEVAAILQETVRRRLADAPPPDRAVERLVRALERGRAVRVDRLADEVGLSERQLLRQCRAALGYGPKTFAGIVRFQRFLADARRPGPGRLAEAARQSGYADQSHLTREVRRLSGLPPARLVAELEGRTAALEVGAFTRSM